MERCHPGVHRNQRSTISSFLLFFGLWFPSSGLSGHPSALHATFHHHSTSSCPPLSDHEQSTCSHTSKATTAFAFPEHTSVKSRRPMNSAQKKSADYAELRIIGVMQSSGLCGVRNPRHRVHRGSLRLAVRIIRGPSRTARCRRHEIETICARGVAQGTRGLVSWTPGRPPSIGGSSG